MGLSCYRCHGRLSRTCVPNLSVDYFNQSCSAESKITPTVILPHKAFLPHEAFFFPRCLDVFADSFRIRIVWFQPKQDSDQMRISFFQHRIGSDSKNPLSDHLCRIVIISGRRPNPLKIHVFELETWPSSPSGPPALCLVLSSLHCFSGHLNHKSTKIAKITKIAKTRLLRLLRCVCFTE